MAEKQEHHVEIGDRVRIKDSVTHMYPRARVYNEGFVRALEYDKLGYPLIYVEWDRDHWAYSGEDDGWTDEAHFDLVEDQMADQDERFDALLSGLSNLVSSFQSEEKQDSAHESASETPQGEANMTYDQVLAKATADAQDAEAFIVLVARPEEYNGTEILAPRIYVHSKSDDAALMLDACMADAVAQTYAGLVMKLITEAKSNGQSGS